MTTQRSDATGGLANPVRTLIRTSLVTLGVAFMGTASAAQGEAGCVRQGRSICVPDAAASLARVDGDVRRSRGVGFGAVHVGDDLVAGDRLIIRQGAAVVNMANHCEVRLGANSLVSFARGGSGLCAIGLFADGATASPAKAPAPLLSPGAKPPDATKFDAR